MNECKAIIHFFLSMFFGIAIYMLSQQVGILSPLQISSPSSVYFDLEPMTNSKGKK